MHVTKSRLVEKGALADFPECHKLAKGSAKELMGISWEPKQNSLASTCIDLTLQERNDLFVKWMTSGQNLERLDPNLG